MCLSLQDIFNADVVSGSFVSNFEKMCSKIVENGEGRKTNIETISLELLSTLIQKDKNDS